MMRFVEEIVLPLGFGISIGILYVLFSKLLPKKMFPITRCVLSFLLVGLTYLSLLIIGMAIASLLGSA